MNALVTKRKGLSAIVVVLILMSLAVPVAMAAPPPPLSLPRPPGSIPPGSIAANFTGFDSPPAGWPAKFQITLSGFSGSYSVVAGTPDAGPFYRGWCLEPEMQVPTPPTPPTPPDTGNVTLYSSYDPALPPDLNTYQDPSVPIVANPTLSVNVGDPIPWNKLNYLLNNQQGTADDVQNAIWYLLWYGTVPDTASAATKAMVATAQASVDFVPGPNQIIAVILRADGIGTFDTGRNIQDTVIELTVPNYDLGDLPQPQPATPTYPTLLADAPSHQLNQLGQGVQNLFLGKCVDSETDGQPDTPATGDDTAVGSPVFGDPQCTDDEDGVTRVAGLGGAGNGGGWTNGTVASNNGGALQVTITGGPACLGAFLDLAHDGTLPLATLRDVNGIPVPQPILAGTYTFYFDIPAGTFNGTTSQPIFARFRIASPVDSACTNSPVLSPTGPAVGGEVEDYVWSFGPNAVTLSELHATTVLTGERLMAMLRSWLQQR